MTYKKPENMSVTDMCIYIDETAYTDEHHESTIFEYLYHIIYALSQNAKLFNQNHYYDEFSVFGASRIYMRLVNKKQYEKDDCGVPRMDKIKSILNYTKNVLYPLKVDFEQLEYCQTLSKQSDENEISYNFENILQNRIDEMTFCEFEMELADVGKTCKKFLKSIPYRVNSSDWLNIYISVMLTFLNNVTLTNKQEKKIEQHRRTMRLTDEHLDNAYAQDSQNKAILFHLHESMSDYILVLSRQLKKIVSNDLTYILHTKVSENFDLIPLSIKDYLDEYGDDCYEY